MNNSNLLCIVKLPGQLQRGQFDQVRGGRTSNLA